MYKLPYPKRRNLRFAIQACIAASLALPFYASAQQSNDTLVEEIIVTGSFIRRDNFNQASPLTIITAVDIEEAGTVNMGDILFNLSASSGTSLGDTTPFTQPNLRGLGAGATMDLMDGHRLLFGDANNTYPQIAIARIDILLDGASALYGAEAVAGVINYI
ncbi:MAG: TonB-dependent receptor plug domain-containing protein, partial [Proteobacteria bacterium]|nr:TonB-dependent receptor plug domain-containing protein [Pseudomonadota bacterium]